MRTIVRWIATLGPVGYAPIAPATAGSAVVALAFLLAPPVPMPIFAAMILCGTAFAIWIADEAEKQLGHDAHPIVIDEVVGQMLALVLVPHTWIAYGIAFALFRVFDVWKPLGAHEAQALPGGVGVVTDDVIAGITACGAFHLGAWAMRAAGWTR
ncbi:MAG: phosphatidylglycerophosphatase A [Candidatus Eisenbacteria bacterium]|nr:phosphatidylglycerophosphatase A [Candidatus Eisenbacteria bacterium]